MEFHSSSLARTKNSNVYGRQRPRHPQEISWKRSFASSASWTARPIRLERKSSDESNGDLIKETIEEV